MMNYIYFDLNAITNFIDEIKSDNDKENKIRKIRKFKIPYSIAHIMDLSSKNSSGEFTKKILDDISRLTSNLFIQHTEDYEKVFFKHYNTHDVYEKYNSNLKSDFSPQEEVNIDFEMPPIEIDMSKIKNKKIISYEILKHNNGILDGNFFKKLITRLYENRDDTKIYKELRSSMTAIYTEYQKQDNPVFDKKSPAGKKLIRAISYFSDRKLTQEKFKRYLDLHFSLAPQPFERLPREAQIELAYKILDFNIEYHDKLKGGNNIGNMNRDIEHFRFCEYAKLYITDDETSRKKAIFLSDYFKLKVKVLSTPEFISYLNKLD